MLDVHVRTLIGVTVCLIFVGVSSLWSNATSAQDIDVAKESSSQQASGSFIASGKFGGKHGNDVPLLNIPASEVFEAGAELQAAQAVSKRDNQKLKELITQISNIDNPGRDGVTLLYWSYLQGNLEAFKLLLQRGASPDVAATEELEIEPGLGLSRTNGFTLLAHAGLDRFMRPGFFEAGFAYTKQPNQRNDAGGTFLHGWVLEPASAKQLKLLREIIAAGVDLDARDMLGYTALQQAVLYNPQAMLVLLDAGANPNIPLPDGRKLIDLVRECQSFGDKEETYQRVLQRLDPPALSQAFTRSVVEGLELSDGQRAEIKELQSHVDQRLGEILSHDQLRKLRQASP